MFLFFFKVITNYCAYNFSLKANTWLELEKKLMPQGRIMINCGGVNAKQRKSHDWVKNSTIKAMSSVFNQVCRFSFFFF